MDNITVGILGAAIGFGGNILLAKLNARWELKKSIGEKRAELYIGLWKLCNRDLNTKKKQVTRYNDLRKWYSAGGGLLLSFNATDRFVGALNLLETANDKKLNEEEMKFLLENLSWMRTEMKYEVGTYSRKEAKDKLPNIKIREEAEEEVEKAVEGTKNIVSEA